MENCKDGDVATIECIPSLINNIVSYVAPYAVGVAIIMILIAAFQFASARGDRQKIEGAKHTMTYAIIGLIIVIFSFVIIRFVASLFGLPSNTILSIPKSF